MGYFWTLSLRNTHTGGIFEHIGITTCEQNICLHVALLTALPQNLSLSLPPSLPLSLPPFLPPPLSLSLSLSLSHTHTHTHTHAHEHMHTHTQCLFRRVSAASHLAAVAAAQEGGREGGRQGAHRVTGGRCRASYSWSWQSSVLIDGVQPAGAAESCRRRYRSSARSRRTILPGSRGRLIPPDVPARAAQTFAAPAPPDTPPPPMAVIDPVYMSRKIRKFRTDKFDTWNKRRFWLMQLM